MHQGGWRQHTALNNFHIYSKKYNYNQRTARIAALLHLVNILAYLTQLSPAIILMSDVAHVSGILQS